MLSAAGICRQLSAGLIKTQSASYTDMPSRASFIQARNIKPTTVKPSRNAAIKDDEGCWLCQNNLQGFDYRDVLVLKEFIKNGKVKTAKETGICKSMDDKVFGAIRKALKHKLLPDNILTEEGYWAMGPEPTPAQWGNLESEWGSGQLEGIHPEQYKYRRYRKGAFNRNNKIKMQD